MGSELTPKFDQEALQRILQRAAELQADERDVSGSLDGNEVLALGRDVGIPERYLRQAMLEVGQVREAPEPEGWLDEMVGAASVHAERVVRGDPQAIEEALVRYLETEEVFGVIRQTEGQVMLEPVGGWQAAVKRATGSRKFMLKKAERVSVTIVPLEPGLCQVVLRATLRDLRRGYIGGAAALLSTAVAGTVVLGALNAFWPVLLMPLPGAFGFSWAIGKAYRIRSGKDAARPGVRAGSCRARSRAGIAPAPGQEDHARYRHLRDRDPGRQPHAPLRKHSPVQAVNGIRSVGVVGAGLMGAGIAQATASAGFDTAPPRRGRSCPQAGARRDGEVHRKVRGEGAAHRRRTAKPRSRECGPLPTSADMSGVDLVIEAVPEDAALKIQLFQDLDSLCPRPTAFASNTSSISIGVLAAGSGRPDRFVGLHFFNPVPLMPLVEVIRGAGTSAETYAAALEFVRQLGKETVEARDVPGFVVNLLLVPFLLDAVRALERGVASTADIDRGMVLGCGHPMGPLTLLDFVGLDTVVRIGEIMRSGYGEERYAAPSLLKRMVAAGSLGRKSGKGFYDYSVTPPAAVELP